MDQTESLVKTLISGLQEKKAKNIIKVDLTHLSGAICQFMIICEGNSPTQVEALSDSAWDFAFKKEGEKPLSVDGKRQAEWIGMDYGTVLVHIFLPDKRTFYNLETLWSDSIVTPIPDLD